MCDLSPAIFFEDVVLLGPFVNGDPLQRLWCPEHLRGDRTVDSKEQIKIIYDELVGDLNSFNSDALNKYNNWFYLQKYIPDNEILHNTFTQDKIVRALGNCILQGSQEPSCRVKVLMAGSSTEDAFEQIAESHSSTQFEVLLSDFFDVPLSNLHWTSNLTIRTVKENILDGVAELSVDERFDVVLCTYGFDSVWMKGDLHYILNDGRWYQSSHRLHQVENGTGDYGSPYIVETVVVFVDDILKVQFGDVINAMYGQCTEARVNVPGGLISTVIDVFEKQLRDDGMIVIGDVCSDGEIVREYEFLESGAMYKIEDYRLAVDILRNFGYNAELQTVQDFVQVFTKDLLREKLLGKYILVVRKQS